MVEYAVKNNTYTVLMQIFAYLFEILVCAEAAVADLVIYRVIAVLGGLKKRSEINGIDVHLLEMRDPFSDLFYTVDRSLGGFGAIGLRTAESEWVDVIEV